MFASVIICTYNRDKYIYNLLKSVAENTLSTDKYEIVLVNNNSTDKTESECERFQADYPSVQFNYHVETSQGLSYARNRGIKESHGDVLVYVDDDALINKEYLQTYVDFFESNLDIHAAGGPILPLYETEEPQWMTKYTRQLLTGKLYLGEKKREFPKNSFPGGGNAAYRKEVFDKVGLFNVDLGRKGDSLIGAEEKDIFDKMTTLGLRFFYLPTSILYHIIPEKKLQKEYFDKLTYSIGKSERIRTKNISTLKYLRRILSEIVKWGASIVFFLYYTITLSPLKGWKLLQFRFNVTKGLLGY
ncbi:MAG: glycosyltransferase family 2 protein [Paludibacteraceae bacterium]|nr:glycosyltransferase family 2 protein [Paludibacteraceae bacterium]